MNNPKIVSREEWVETRKQFLVQEKEFSEHRGRGRLFVLQARYQVKLHSTATPGLSQTAEM